MSAGIHGVFYHEGNSRTKHNELLVKADQLHIAKMGFKNEELSNETVSKKKKRSYNTNLLLWRMMEHEQCRWHSDDLQALYKSAVSPFGYKFPAHRIIANLFYKSFLVADKNSNDDCKFAMNKNKIELCIANANQAWPPHLSESVKEALPGTEGLSKEKPVMREASAATKKRKSSKRNRKKANIQAALRESGLLPDSRHEWSVPSQVLRENRKTFLDQRHTIHLRNKTSIDLTPPQEVDILCCDVCNTPFDNINELDEHNETGRHKFMVLYSQCSDQDNSDKPPLELSGELDSITIQSKAGSEGSGALCQEFILHKDGLVKESIGLDVLYNPKIGNQGSCVLVETHIIFGDDKILKEENKSPMKLEPNTAGQKVFLLECKYPTFLDYVVAFKFYLVSKGDSQVTQELFVMKQMNIKIDYCFTAVDPGDKRLKTQEFHMDDKKDYNIIEPHIVEVAAVELPKTSLDLVRRLGDYPLPWKLIRQFNYGFSVGPEPYLPSLKRTLTTLNCLLDGAVPFNYKCLYQLLLFLEEHQILCNLRKYALQSATLREVPLTYDFYLEVPGLAENRPSVLPGDAIYITTEAGIFKGFVKRVKQTELRFTMGTSFVNNFYPDMLVAVHFSFNRSCLRVQHRAIELMDKSPTMMNTLYPNSFGKHKTEIKIKTWYNPRIKDNPMQLQAVQNIVNGSSMPAPYLLFGPPGTGKTVTLVECIKQICALKEDSHILAAAPSNAAADLIAMKLLENTSVPPRGLIRIYSPSVNYSRVPAELQNVCNFMSKNINYVPDREHLMKYKVIVVTMICAGRFFSGNFPQGHFTHIFIDECGHGMEPSALVPIAGLQGPASKPSQIVLSGDPMQLGPIIQSPMANAFGLGDSLLVRLMETELYRKDMTGYNANVLTKLTYNYRSHPHILKVPNELFYDGELIPCGDMEIISSACKLEWLPRPNFPLIFHGLKGRDEQHPNSPSYFNRGEAHEVLQYVRKVLTSDFNGKFLKQREIGVVSPYRGQLDKIRRILEDNGFGDVSVGSVEEFQGQERRVIIISTVRSNPAKLQLDHKFSLGFVREPKRFNVAVTRASALLIVIGNPHILQEDPNWRSLLEFIFENGGYTHTDCPFKLGKMAPLQSQGGLGAAKINKSIWEQKLKVEETILKMEEEEEERFSYEQKPLTCDTETENLVRDINRLVLTPNIFSDRF
ncbi:Hypothetical predicted protein [Cloeon dipterum]|uniref:RNA helicase n=2 Tax=Cloeon dipterum TaxID=197152 RepID=A0A8S1CM35_9INSE|nr:Hypothetical predicted protein [Cloeon dipterum]